MLNTLRQNTKIREKLFKYVDSLLNVTIAIPEMASLLTEVWPYFNVCAKV